MKIAIQKSRRLLLRPVYRVKGGVSVVDKYLVQKKVSIAVSVSCLPLASSLRSS